MEFEVLKQDSPFAAPRAEQFWDRTLPYEQWNHAAHLAVALDAVARWGRDEALARLRDGIRAYNEANEVINSPMGGYHETLTVFFVSAVADFYNIRRGEDLKAIYSRLLETWGAKNAVLAYYSRRHLFSPYARMEWRAPDLQPLPFELAVVHDSGSADA